MRTRSDTERAIAAEARELATQRRALAADGVDPEQNLQAALWHDEAARLHAGLAIVYDREDNNTA